MDAGKLRKRITFLAPTANQDAYGEDRQTWTPIYSCWAGIQPLRGGIMQVTQANTAATTATHQITIRYCPTINEEMRISYGPQSSEEFDFDALNSIGFDVLAGFALDDLQSQSPPPPIIYTINSILDTNSDHKMQVILATTAKN